MYLLWKVISVKGKSLWVNETERVGGENVFTYTNKFRKTIKFWIRSAKKIDHNYGFIGQFRRDSLIQRRLSPVMIDTM